jgi:hypothetical protein
MLLILGAGLYSLMVAARGEAEHRYRNGVRPPAGL